MLNRFLRVQLPALKERILYSCARFLEIEPSRLPCFTEDLEMDSMLKISMTVAIRKGRQSHCLSLNTMEIVSGVLQRLSGRVMRRPAGREILAPSSSLSPINDPIRSYNQRRLSSAGRIGDHSLEMHYVHLNHLSEITSVGLILINLSMSV